jgi:type II secretory pathway component PulJ
MLKIKGYSLIELMIFMALGLSVIAAVSVMYLGMVKNSGEALQVSKMNREIEAAMDYMVTDLRRSGYWGNAILGKSVDATLTISAAGTEATGVDFSAFANPVPSPTAKGPLIASRNPPSSTPDVGKFQITGFRNNTEVTGLTLNSFHNDTLAPGTWYFINPFAEISILGSCVLYCYDRNKNGLFEDVERFGLRLSNGAIQKWSDDSVSAWDCAVDDAWKNLTDPTITRITTLSFSLQEQTVNLSTAKLIIRDININLASELSDDSQSRKQLTEKLRVRNDIFQL